MCGGGKVRGGHYPVPCLGLGPSVKLDLWTVKLTCASETSHSILRWDRAAAVVSGVGVSTALRKRLQPVAQASCLPTV